MHLALPYSHEELGMTRKVSTHIFTTTLATRPQCEATSCIDAAIQDDWKGIREVGEQMALKKYEDLVRKYHLVRFDFFLKMFWEQRRIESYKTLNFSFQKVADGKTLLNDGKFYYQRSRVKKLHELGATVYLCSGRRPNGVFHKKAVIADRRWMFSGGANLTHSARHANSEFLMKLTGKGVMDALASLEQERLKARLWDGRFA